MTYHHPSVPLTQFDNRIGSLEEFLDCVVDQCIDNGASRRVYSTPLQFEGKDVVIKVETGDMANSQNIEEIRVWEELVGTRWEGWLAPIFKHSRDGRVLIMQKTQPVIMATLPDRVPRFFTDCKRTNFGTIEGRTVCHDYGLNSLSVDGQGNYWKQPEWRDE